MISRLDMCEKSLSERITVIYFFFELSKKKTFVYFFMLMVNLGSTDDSGYTGFREITDRDILDLQCIIMILCSYDQQIMMMCRIQE